MALINSSIPSLVGGVSQQAAALRHPTQVEAQDNCVPSLASGLRKRTGHQYIGKLAEAGNDHQFAYVHSINRGAEGIQERYFVVLNNGTLKVFDFRSGQIPCTFPDGTGYLEGTFLMRDSFHAVTVADYTFISNKRKLCVMEGDVVVDGNEVDPNPQKFFLVIRQGVINTSYFVNLNGTLYSHSTGDATTIKTIDIANALAEEVNNDSGGDFQATPYDNLIVFEPKAGSGITVFTCASSDTWGDQASFGFTNKVARYEDLPRKFIEGPVIEVQGSPEAGASWYVTWKRDAANQDGVWVETCKPGLLQNIDASKMPHVLVRLEDGTFEFRQADWKPRVVGDGESNPLQSFIGAFINGVFFHRNRLGFLTDENIVMSQAGDYFNFFASSARADTDSDPIDISASTNKITILRHIIPFDRSMLVFSEKQQFQFVSGETLTGRNAKLEPTTAFEAGPYCPPAAMGKNVFFATNRGNYTSIREYYYDGDTVTNDAADITAHCPSYLPTHIYKLIPAPTEEMLFALSHKDGERNKVWVYNTAWHGQEKVQSAWHRWVFPPTDLIVDMSVFGSTLCFIVQRPDGLYLDMMELEENPYSPTSYTVCLDQWVGYEGGNYDPGQKRTFWTLPYDLQPDETPVVIICNKQGEAGQGIVPQLSAPNVVSLPGDYEAALSVVGVKYDASVTLSQQFARDGKDNSIINARLQLRDMSLQFEKTGWFKATVTPTGREAVTYEYSGKRLGLAAMKIGTEITESGSFKFPIMAQASEVTVKLSSDAHTPFTFLAGEWQGSLNMQAMRR